MKSNEPPLLQAQTIIEGIANALVQRGLIPALVLPPFVANSLRGNTWLIATLDQQRIRGRFEAYCTAETLHQISTYLDGRPVFLSNSTGIRYLVLVSQRPRLPGIADFPHQLPGDDQFPFGLTAYGPLAIRPQQFINMIVAGSQGSGKSVFLTGLAISAHAYGYQLYLADPDLNTFDPENWNAVATMPVAQTDDEFLALLKHLTDLAKQRSALFREAAGGGSVPANLDEYNARTGSNLPRILLLVDEANTYFDSPEAATLLADLGRRGRKWSIYIILAAHNWRSSDVPRALSAMFPTRLCLRVGDDTSGRVVLGSPAWGKRAMSIRLETPGRGILFYNGQFRWLQTYNVARQQQQALIRSVSTANPLSDTERALVRYAIEELNGRFVINRLARAFTEQGITHHQINQLALHWEKQGWLTPPETNGRRISAKLRQLAGCAQTAEQDKQAEQRQTDRTGCEQVEVKDAAHD